MQSDIYKYDDKAIHSKDESDFNKFSELIELPDTKPLIITDTTGKILYANQSFKRIFELTNGNSVSEIKAEPNLEVITQNLENSIYRNFQFDLLYQKNYEEEPSSYLVDVDRLLIDKHEFLLFTFDSYTAKKELKAELIISITRLNTEMLLF